MRPLVNIIQKRHLRANDLTVGTDSCLKFDLNHMSGLKAASIRYAVDKGFVKIKYQCLLVRSNDRRA